MQEVLKPDHIALMHLPIRLESDAPGKIDQVRKYYKDIFLLLPGMPSKVYHAAPNVNPAAQAPRLDIFFTPTFGGEIDALRALKPRAVFPMHDGGREQQHLKFAEKIKTLGLDVAV